MVFFGRERVVENIEKRKKTNRKMQLKNGEKKTEEYRESQITTTNIFGFAFYIKNYILLERIVWKK